MSEMGAVTKISRTVDLAHLRLACVACGDWLPEIRLSPEAPDLIVVYVRPCARCFPPKKREG